MSSKAYTMREMKGIVDYLLEHKAYNEIKGRKMWMNFANSQMTTRTWQSLKETFLKRILPDIYNPYYKLTMEQVRSFKEGRDIEAKKGNKLETQTLSDSSSNAEIQKNCEQPSTSKAQTKEAEMTTGEDIKPAKIPSEPRSSADTVVLEVYYNNAEEIKNVLENNIDNEKNVDDYSKNIRDCLTFEYSPFNIEAMKVLEDFATESEGSDKEPRMQIDENPVSPVNDENPKNEGNVKSDDAPIEIHDSSDLEINEKDANEVDQIIEELNKDTGKRNSYLNKHKEAIEDQDIVTEKEKTVETKTPADKTENITIVDEIENSDTIIPPNKTASPQKSNSIENSDTIIPSNKTAYPRNSANLENSDTIIPPNKTASPKKSINIENANTTITTNKSASPIKSVNLENSDTIIPPNKTASPKKSNSIATPITTNSTDASLPNNQEGFNVKKLTTTEDKTVKKKTRKRSSSTNSNTSKKVKLNNEKYNNKDKIVEETDKIDKPSTEEKMDVEPNHIEISSKSPNNAEETENKKHTNENGLKLTNDVEINPCLNSVSLYAEQFNTIKYSDDEVETVKEIPLENTKKDLEIQEEATKAIETQEKVKENITTLENKEVNNKTNKAHAIVDNTLNQTQVERGNKSDVTPENTDASNKKPLPKLSLKKTGTPTKIYNKPKEVLVLKSNSDSVSSDGKANYSQGKVTMEKKKSKERDLANILGFLGGGNRKRNISHRRLGNQRHSVTLISESSEWSSESDEEEYVSPPRGRKNRHTKRYVKPKSARILSLDEDGGLFVMHGKRMFPVVRDGHLVKNYVAMNTDSNSEEEEENYWKQKYVQEKIRADELEKRLKESNAQKLDPTIERKSPILQSNTLLRNLSSHKPHNEVGNLRTNQEISKETPKIQSSQEKLKICFSKNNQEVQLEGYWSTLHPALQQVVQLLHTDEGDAKAKPARRPSVQTDIPAKTTEKPTTGDKELETVEINSGKTTPIIPTVDPEVHEKINKIESEIFKEIEDLESKVEGEKTPEPEDDSNVTKRPVRVSRPKKLAPSTSKAKSIKKDKSPNTPAKETRSNSKPQKSEQKQNGDQIDKATTNIEDTLEKQNGVENNSVKSVEIKTRRSSRAPKRFSEDNTTQNRVTRRSVSRKTEPPAIDDDEGIRYMFPPNEPKQTSKVAKRR